MLTITITLPDSSTRKVAKGAALKEVAASLSSSLTKEAIAAEVNGALVDMPSELQEDCSLRILTWEDKKGQEIFRHSSTHILAQAVTKLFPNALPTIGPVVDEGFYYDFDAEPFSQEDLPKIEAEMQRIIKANYKVERIELTKEKAKELFRHNPYKLELIEDHYKEGLSAYKQGNYIDFCRGPHVPSTGMVKAIKITKTAGAYWKGDQKNKQLQRIYGISFPRKKQMEEYLSSLEEAKQRDHKKIAKELELYTTFELVGKGLPIWLPKGETIKREIENFAIETESKAGYLRVATPHLAKKELYLKSGHIPHFQENMYPEMKLDDGTYFLKAMNCPHHHLVFGYKTRSYRDLPLRIAEYGTCYRNELSGTLSGLLRVRMLSMNDAHIYCTKEQIEAEFENVIRMITSYYAVFGLTDYYFRLSLGNPENKEKYIDGQENWKMAESILRNVLKKNSCNFTEAADEAAFYGPKVDIQYKTVTGREETLSTIQLDFAAKEKFGLGYMDKDGRENKEVYVIHRAPLSTHERFMAFIIEHFAGKFPLWLAPVQVKIVTVTEKVVPFAEEVKKKCEEKNIRVDLDSRDESVGYKIREAQAQKIPLMLTIGEKEVESNSVAVRTLNGKVKFGVKVENFLTQVKKNIEERKIAVPFS
ncbi:MAG TPA: threonine--tRNA ligase [Candidatus Nanoarchaeia archaeon]|nr:threonine--tRNA ligase [Candidatus Nanoarchaeia archaeon]